jgi:hypothetical protein
MSLVSFSLVKSPVGGGGQSDLHYMCGGNNRLCILFHLPICLHSSFTSDLLLSFNFTSQCTINSPYQHVMQISVLDNSHQSLTIYCHSHIVTQSLLYKLLHQCRCTQVLQVLFSPAVWSNSLGFLNSPLISNTKYRR